MQPEHGRRRCAIWQLAALDHLGDDADAAEIAVLARQQEYAILLACVDRQGCRDRREDDRFLKWDQKKAHTQSNFRSYSRKDSNQAWAINPPAPARPGVSGARVRQRVLADQLRGALRSFPPEHVADSFQELEWCL